jgi:hypothetical protein
VRLTSFAMGRRVLEKKPWRRSRGGGEESHNAKRR